MKKTYFFKPPPLAEKEESAASYLAENLFLIRNRRKLSQEKFAEVCKIPRSTLAVLEQGLGNPSLKLLSQLSKELEVTIDSLLTRRKLVFTHKKQKDFHSKNLNEKINQTEIISKSQHPFEIHLVEIERKGSYTFPVNSREANSVEFFYCLEGSVSFSTGVDFFEMNPGDLVYGQVNVKRTLLAHSLEKAKVFRIS